MGGIHMIRVPHCLKGYLGATRTGDRNTHLFTVAKRVRELNPQISQGDLYKNITTLNQNLQDPLNKRELRTITHSVMGHQYKASCLPFRKFCNPSGNCQRNKPYNTTQKGLWKEVDLKNKLKRCKPVEVYPWDVEDTSKLTMEQRESVLELREFKEVNPLIDYVMKNKRVKIGDKSLNEWNRHRGMIENGS